MKPGTLYIFSGLPASGKSTLARELAKRISATFVRIDTIEQGLRDVCKLSGIEGEGYRLSYWIAKDNLVEGNDVIADSVNPWELTRREWTEVATSVGANFMNIEVVCTDKAEHKSRVETRDVGILNLKPTTWTEVLNRDYHAWQSPRLVIDTAGKSVEESVHELVSGLKIHTMDLNHIQLNTKDVKKTVDYYGKYFGFTLQKQHGDGYFLWNQAGFMMAVNPLAENPVFPDWFHIGFRLESPARVRDMYEKLRTDECPIKAELQEHEDFVFFRATDPTGYIVEIFWEPVHNG